MTISMVAFTTSICVQAAAADRTVGGAVQPHSPAFRGTDANTTERNVHSSTSMAPSTLDTSVAESTGPPGGEQVIAGNTAIKNSHSAASNNSSKRSWQQQTL